MEFDRWYSQEMRAPDGSYIKRLQDAAPEELAAATEAVTWLLLFEREAFGTIHGRPVTLTEKQALEEAMPRKEIR